jgi:PAS domain S-box-containing protein
VEFEDGMRSVDVRIHPVLRDGDPARGFYLVVFKEGETEPQPAAPAATGAAADTSISRHLEEEVAQLKAQLRTTVEQYETHVEDAKASNEELQAMNEELRSAAEELETSREELQSLNEELSTVNQELKVKIDELRLTNSDFQNLINATAIGTIFLDAGLRLKLFTPRAREVFNLLDSDVGRPLSDITSKLHDESIHQDVRTVLERLSTVEREVQTADAHWHLMRILPYRTIDNRIDGVVITFQDVTGRRTAEMQARQIDERMRLLVEGALEYAIFTTRENGDIDTWNEGAERMFGYSSREIVGSNIRVLFTPEDRERGRDISELEEAVRTGRSMDERYHVRKDGTLLYCSGVTRRLDTPGGGFAKIARDLTAQRRASEALQRAHDDLEIQVANRTRELADEVRKHLSAKETLVTVVKRLVTAQEDERRRVARDLHDDMGQRVTALRLMLEQARQTPDPARELEQALQLIASLDDDLTFLSWQLRPALLDELGLSAALPRFISQWSAHTGIPAEFRAGGYKQGQLDTDAEIVFYRAAQEALNNIAKHAHATRADIVLGTNDGHVVLVIEDDGVGFDPMESAAAPDGFGLMGMRERAGLIGATLDIESSPGRGTSVFLRLPL